MRGNEALENLLAKGGAGQLNGEVGGAVVLVDDGVNLDDLEAEHAAVVGEDLHGQVRFAIGGAAAHRRADAGSIFGVDPVHVERDVVAGGAVAGRARGLLP